MEKPYIFPQQPVESKSKPTESACEPNPNSSAHRLTAQYSSSQFEQTWRSCWTASQKDDFPSKNNWLFYNNREFGRTTCKGVGNIVKTASNISEEKKKIEPKESAVHKAAVKIIEEEAK
ncbi:hypothetical protein PR048_000453 [Dryococelus australis]|uniref:Uncharacterized protein n=1 Tax=Dryococelus australis TaxID=614101 RepID=A0ABQ9IEN3_9NEOP|nr:hypothetical protein PR048_000453 [Dryococelus australis]